MDFYQLPLHFQKAYQVCKIKRINKSSFISLFHSDDNPISLPTIIDVYNDDFVFLDTYLKNNFPDLESNYGNLYLALADVFENIYNKDALRSKQEKVKNFFEIFVYLSNNIHDICKKKKEYSHWDIINEEQIEVVFDDGDSEIISINEIASRINI